MCLPDAHIAAWKPLVEIAREIIVAYVLVRLVAGADVTRLGSALGLGFWLWLGFPAAMLVGASLWDDKPWLLSLIRGGDWLIKLLVMPGVIMLVRRLTVPSSRPSEFLRVMP